MLNFLTKILIIIASVVVDISGSVSLGTDTAICKIDQCYGKVKLCSSFHIK